MALARAKKPLDLCGVEFLAAGTLEINTHIEPLLARTSDFKLRFNDFQIAHRALLEAFLQNNLPLAQHPLVIARKKIQNRVLAGQLILAIGVRSGELAAHQTLMGDCFGIKITCEKRFGTAGDGQMKLSRRIRRTNRDAVFTVNEGQVTIQMGKPALQLELNLRPGRFE